MEERVFDTLLMLPGVAAFTSMTAAAHGLPHAQLSPAEQVLGKARMTQVQVLLGAGDHSTVLEHLRNQFAGSGLRYWLLPVIEAGEFA
jgi:hypothetical protein